MIYSKQNPWLFRFDPLFPIRVFLEEQDDCPLHTHEPMEIVFIITGKSEHLSNVETTRRIGRGNILILPPGVAHGYSNSHELKLINLLFDSKNLPLPLLELSHHPGYKQIFFHNAEYWQSNRKLPSLFLEESEFLQMENLLTQFIHSETMLEAGKPVAKMGFLMVVLSKLCDYYVQTHPATLQEMPLDIVKIIRYFNNNFMKPLYLPKLAKMCNMSQNTFLRGFKRNFGKSPMKYILELRLQYAAALLLDSSLPVNEIAEKVGIPNSSYFSRAFRNHYGRSPLDYRSARPQK